MVPRRACAAGSMVWPFPLCQWMVENWWFLLENTADRAESLENTGHSRAGKGEPQRFVIRLAPRTAARKTGNPRRCGQDGRGHNGEVGEVGAVGAVGLVPFFQPNFRVVAKTVGVTTAEFGHAARKSVPMYRMYRFFRFSWRKSAAAKIRESRKNGTHGTSVHLAPARIAPVRIAPVRIAPARIARRRGEHRTCSHRRGEHRRGARRTSHLLASPR